MTTTTTTINTIASNRIDGHHQTPLMDKAQERTITTPMNSFPLIKSKIDTSTASSSSRKSKKRVRFEEEEDDNVNRNGTPATTEGHHQEEDRPIKRRIIEIPLPKSSLLTREEKQYYWMQMEDHRATLQDVMKLVHDCHHENEEGEEESKSSSSPSSDEDDDTGSSTTSSKSSSSEDETQKDPNKVPFAQYAEALAITFTLCDQPPIHDDDDDDDDDEVDNDTTTPKWNIRKSSLVGQLALWATHHMSTRGIESKILPGLMQERQSRRTKVIQSILQAQKTIMQSIMQKQQEEEEEERVSNNNNNNNNKQELLGVDYYEQLCTISERLTYSAKQFASAMAVVDGTQALIEYTSMQQQQKSDEEDVSPPFKK